MAPGLYMRVCLRAASGSEWRKQARGGGCSASGRLGPIDQMQSPPPLGQSERRRRRAGLQVAGKPVNEGGH